MYNMEEIFTLNANQEQRFVINDPSEPVTIVLLKGTAEIFGAEMLLNKIYTFPYSFAVVTLHGCDLKLIGNVAKSYSVARNSGIYDLHSSLERSRSRAEREGGRGPVTLIAGPTDVGKSTICRSLLNYASRLGRKPLFVDLDVGQSSVSIPGTMSILPIDSPGDVVKGFDEQKLSVYYFGYKSPGLNMLLYFLLIQRLGETIQCRARNSRDIAISGAIIDTCGWVIGQGYQSIVVAAKSFTVDTIIVIADRKLLSQLKHDVPPHVELKFIPKLSGVVERNQTYRRHNRDSLIHEYFYGTQFSIEPYVIQVKFSDVEIFKVTSSRVKINLNLLSDIRNYISLLPVSISPVLMNQVLALSYVDDLNEDIILTSVLGFIHVKHVDMEHQVLTFLSPQSNPLPKRFLIMGDLQFDFENR